MKDFLSWVEIDKKALLLNIASFRKLLGPKVKFLAIVKGNAYGHGLTTVARIVKNKVDWFGVNSLDEALELKKLKIRKPILILGYTQLSRLQEVIKNDFRQVVYNKKTASALVNCIDILKYKNKVRVHLKIETGTNRQGVADYKLLEIVKVLKKSQVEIEGVSTHFATLEEEENNFYHEQLKIFNNQIILIEQQKLGVQPLIKPLIKHTASTAAVILYPETYFDMVRVGIGLYGLWPSESVQKTTRKKGIKFELKPVLTWKTKIVQVKEVKKGETIGYGRTYRAKNNMLIAILPVGYYDGYDRHLSNQGRVLINGKFAPVVGRVMMNMIVADISHIKGVQVEDEAVLIGKQEKNEIKVEELAEKIGTINYEVVTRINPLLPRIVV